MAVTVWKVGDKRNSQYYKEFFVDSVSDIADLPTNQEPQDDSEFNFHEYCATGSCAFVADTGDLYVLKSTGEWKLV